MVVSPINVRAPKVARTRFGRAWEQRSINDAYRRQSERDAPQRRVTWLAETPLEGDHGNRLTVAR